LEALKMLVEARRRAGKDDKGRYNLLQEAVQLDPDFALAHADLGEYFYLQSERGKGEEHFTKALSLLNRLTLREKLWIQAIADEYRGNRERAADYYKTYLDRYPDESRAWFRLGYSYLILDRCDQAIEAFKKCLEITPSEGNAYLNIATCYSKMKNYAEAVPHYLKAFDINPRLLTSRNINHEFGVTYIYLGKLKEAEDTFNKMLSASDSESKARGHRSLALLNTYQGQYSAAIGHLKESILLRKSLDSKMSEYRDRYFLATTYKTKGMVSSFRAELAAIRTLLAGSSLAPEWLSSAGELHARSGMISEASRLLENLSSRLNDLTADSMIQRSNRSDRTNYDLLKGEIELARGNYNEALNLLQSNRPSESLAYCYLMRGELDKAISTYQQIISNKALGNESQEKWILAHYYLGKAYEQRGEHEGAIEAYENFLSIWKDADPDLVPLVDAKRRLAKLKSGHKASNLGGQAA
jgi:eukaryotic-like serine/threonine-protein kinase